MSVRRRIDPPAGSAAVDAVIAGAGDRDTVALAVRYLLEVLASDFEGHTVEVRVPPWGAVQAIEGPRHTRGTPPNVIETDAATWIALATGSLRWDEAVAGAAVAASGQRADLREVLPLSWRA
ncbi:sterol carrier family protein [Lysinimonas soli]|uniref:Sterol carrier family protein n=1 Tax=Lysinimonas soli TaxID=1074233 RepID=A0ABW0NP78_9MICO